MRKNIKIPRVLKINLINGLSISVIFNNGESRIIDFSKLLTEIGVKDDSAASVLFNPIEFAKVKLIGNTLSWDNVEQYISSKTGDKIKVPYEIGADILLKFSYAEKSESVIKIGQLIKETRLKTGLTQQDLAIISGTSRTYISRIENNRSDIELATLRKIIETGLGKRLDIRIL
ncbi:MAG: helix-turn-helix domain-containing [Prolixibacteraceae bacterium]|nr:MAG: helix-turn-helix domain-containing [Prolixibacteraceae bacterium]